MSEILEEENALEKKTLRKPWTLAAIIFLAAAAALPYSNALNTPFLFDDAGNIVENPSIRSLWPLWKAFWAPKDFPVGGRPLTNFTYALNFALGGENPWGFHLSNIAIHVLCALVFFGFCRRTLCTSLLRDRYGGASTALAFCMALLWAMHPLQTESVTYISQRAECLMGLFFLLTFYCALAGWQSRDPHTWHAWAALCFILGAGAKESIAAAPACILLYDMLFMGRTPAKALKQSPILYAGMAAGLAFLAAMALAGRAGTGGPPTEPFTFYEYLYHQPEVLARYLFLTLWPGPLCLDYLWIPLHPARALPYVLLFSMLVAASALALLRKKPAGFLGAWFFLILAPASSIIPLPDMAFEHRMYLPLAAPVALVVLGTYSAIQRLPGALAKRRMLVAGMAAVLLIALAFGVRTHLRNNDYASDLALWENTVKNAPRNARARFNLARALEIAGRTQEANQRLRETIRLNPEFAAAHYNLGSNLLRAGMPEEGVRHLWLAVTLEPRYTKARLNLGTALHYLGKDQEAIRQFHAALRVDPYFADAYANLAMVLALTGKIDEARDALRRALYINPQHPMALKCRQTLEGY